MKKLLLGLLLASSLHGAEEIDEFRGIFVMEGCDCRDLDLVLKSDFTDGFFLRETLYVPQLNENKTILVVTIGANPGNQMVEKGAIIGLYAIQERLLTFNRKPLLISFSTKRLTDSNWCTIFWNNEDLTDEGLEIRGFDRPDYE